MKTTLKTLVSGAVCALAVTATAQVFNCGSTGTVDMVVAANTNWTVPDDGKFHLNSLVIESNVTLTFNRATNGLNPPVYLLARSNLTIHGTISLNGQHGAAGVLATAGGPGGFDGGSFLGGNGHGPGRGYRVWDTLFRQYSAGGGAFGGLGGVHSGPIYGNRILIPLIGGSGGSGSPDSGATAQDTSGGGGGGAVLFASDTQFENYGVIQARGGSGSPVGGGYSGWSGGGSGGAIRIVAPSVRGNGIIDVSGGSSGGDNSPYPFGGGGRVRIDCLPTNVVSLVITGNTTIPWSIGRNPMIFPPAPAARLDILSAGGIAISEGTNSAVSVTLPSGSSSNQEVTLQAKNFAGAFQTYLEATPESGSSYRTNFLWDVGASSLAVTNYPVVIPANTPTRITAWAEYSF